MCSADVSSKYIHQDKGPDYPLDVHSWYFMYDELMLSQMQQMQHAPPPLPVYQQNLYPMLNEQPPNYDQAMSTNK